MPLVRRVTQRGNSRGITLPASVARLLEIEVGDMIELVPVGPGSLLLKIRKPDKSVALPIRKNSRNNRT